MKDYECIITCPKCGTVLLLQLNTMRNAGEPADWAGTLRAGTAFQEFVNGLNLT